ncbi:MAG: hypothetical protein ABIL46_09280 [candidate division WOR-3 bacterium]
MLIYNFTRYRTDDLRKIFQRGVKENVKRKGLFEKFKRLLIDVRYSKSGITGRVARGTAWILIRLPKKINKKFLPYLAIIFDHELLHVRGYKHNDSIMKKDLDVEKAKWISKYKLRKRSGRPSMQKHKLKIKRGHKKRRKRKVIIIDSF